MKKNVAVIFGGRSVEHDISVITAITVMRKLSRAKYNVFPIYIRGDWYTGDKLTEIESYRSFKPSEHVRTVLVRDTFYALVRGKLKRLFTPAVALLCTHGGDGEDGSLQGLLNVHDVPYTSAGVLSSAITMDKVKMKELFDFYGFPSLPYVAFSAKERDGEIEEIEKKIGYPVIVKPATLGSSIGISVAKNKEELLQAVEVARLFDDSLIAERALIGFSEYNQAISEGLLSSVERPLTASEILTFEDKYVSAKGRELPAAIDEELAGKICRLTSEIYDRFGLSGVVRVDYLFDTAEKRLYVGEINSIPGSLSLYLFSAAGIKESDLLDGLVEGALKRRRDAGTKRTDFRTDVLAGFCAAGSKYLKK